MRLQEFMQTDIKTIDHQAAASEAWSLMDRQNIHHLIVLEDNNVVGVLSDKDLGGALGREIVQGHQVSDVMTPQVISAKPTTTVKEAANLMRGHHIHCLPVFDGKRLVGIVTSSDLLGLIGKGLERPQQLNQDYMHDQGHKVLSAHPAYKQRGGSIRQR